MLRACRFLSAPSKSAMTAAVSGMRMLSSVTNEPFPPEAQEVLRASAAENKFTSPYWLTLAQARRTCNAVVRFGEQPTDICLNVHFVIPFQRLPAATRSMILNEHPPYFGGGVGILIDKFRWNAVLATRLVELLNPDNLERALFVDVRFARTLGVEGLGSGNDSSSLAALERNKHVIDVRAMSSVKLFNADQLTDPYLGEPQRGVALSATTGKRVPQPAHDVLLATGILRGYTSPFWLDSRLLIAHDVTLKSIARLAKRVKGARKKKDPEIETKLEEAIAQAGVRASTMIGMCMPLDLLPYPSIREALLQERLNNGGRCASLSATDHFQLYSGNGWEPVRSRQITRAMSAALDELDERLDSGGGGGDKTAAARYTALRNRLARPDQERSLLFVNVDEFILRRADLTAKPAPGETAGSGNTVGTVLTQFAQALIADSTAFQLEEVSSRVFINACELTQPHLVVPNTRSVAFVGGRLVGKRDEALLRQVALARKFECPIWVTVRTARELGVAILPAERRRGVQLGRSGAAAAASSTAADALSTGFYNVEDLAESAQLLKQFPPPSRGIGPQPSGRGQFPLPAPSTAPHFVLEGRWRQVLGRPRLEALRHLDRGCTLWISVSEAMMNGYAPKPGVRPIALRRRSDLKAASNAATPERAIAGTSGIAVLGEEGPKSRTVWNALQTTDPVRVIGVSHCFTRPQGGLS